MRRTVERRKLRPAKREPHFASEAEAAEWFGAHDTSQLPGEVVRDDESQAGSPPRLETIAVRVSAREIEELKRRAARLGIGYTTYARMLINRHVLSEPPIGFSE